MQPIASSVLEVKSRKDRQLIANYNRRAFARIMVASDMHRVFRENSSKTTASLDSETDNLGKGKFKVAMANMCYQAVSALRKLVIDNLKKRALA